jgi:hypothetical protein
MKPMTRKLSGIILLKEAANPTSAHSSIIDMYLKSVAVLVALQCHFQE